jgi:predicted HTH domain antitoxin
MVEAITLTLPADLAGELRRTPQELARDLRLYAGLMMFQLGKLSSGAAAHVAGVPRVEFLDLCADYGIAVSRISAEDLRSELNNE